PSVEPAVAGFVEILVAVVVDGVAGDDESDRRYPQGSGVVGVGVAELDRAKRVTFQVDPFCWDHGGVDLALSDLAGKPGVPHDFPVLVLPADAVDAGRGGVHGCV